MSPNLLALLYFLENLLMFGSGETVTSLYLSMGIEMTGCVAFFWQEIKNRKEIIIKFRMWILLDGVGFRLVQSHTYIQNLASH